MKDIRQNPKFHPIPKFPMPEVKPPKEVDTIIGLRDARELLEREITDKLIKFQEEYNCELEINFRTEEYFNGLNKIFHTDIKVIL